MKTQKSNPLLVESSLDLLLVLLYAPGATSKPAEPIDGITRLQKLMFLLQQGQGPSELVAVAKEYLFDAYKMGPFSQGLYEDIDIAKSLGLLRVERLHYLITDDRSPQDEEREFFASLEDESPRSREVISSRFRLTSKGEHAGRDLLASLSRRDREGLIEFKKFFNALSLRQLLIFVYQKYPDFTTKSEIKGQLGLE